ncbi:MAG: FAD-dependent oxidoreductase [Lachnospiraceae bacterium]|nr:FAD-dependent oxidoreductase [Lachnospiraceae bacterium]
MEQYIIIGNGVATVGCIEGIRSVDKESPITVVSGENHKVYGRPLISYYLEGKTDLEKMKYRPDDFYDKNGVTLLLGKKAVSVTPSEQSAGKTPEACCGATEGALRECTSAIAGTVTLDDGTTLPYTKLCVATGSSPFVPPFENLESVKEKYSFMTLDDSLALEKALFPEAKVLIVGAGLIGLKCAEGILDRVASVTICDLADRVLSSILDTECAALMQRHLEKNGMTFLLGDSVARFETNKAFMKSGKEVDFDVLVLAVGVRANIGLVKDAGGETDRGIVVDEDMSTSLPGIYAAGDCAQGPDLSIGAKRVLAILPNAYMQGHTAGVNMAGGEATLKNAIPMNSIGFFGLHAMTAGSYEGELYEEKTEDSIKRLFTKDDVLKGYILIGRNERAGIYTSMIREKTPISSVNFDVLRKAATTVGFSKQTRKDKFSVPV